jgi:two-component system chemotaxis response regulator CheY
MAPPHARILVVEDSRIHARVIQRCLNAYDLTLTRTAEDAVPILVSESFDLLIVDWGLPEASGLSLVRAVRNDPDVGSLPILMQTAKDRAEHVSEAVQAGVDDYVVKPVNCSQLCAKVSGLLAPER